MEYLPIFGFRDAPTFLRSLIKTKMFTLPVITTAAILTVIQDFVGMPMGVIAAFIMLNLLELLTGLSAAKRNGQVWESYKMNRFVLKTITYIMALGILNVFTVLPIPFSDSLFAGMYWMVFVGISTTLIRSVFENLHLMGVKEAQVIYNLLDNKITGWLKELAAPPHDDKSKR
jgi:Bacteriophage holin family